MTNSENWMLLQYRNKTSRNIVNISNENFRNSLEKTLYYAFLSLPETNASVSVGTANFGHSLKKRIENIVKGLLAENIIINVYSEDSNLVRNNYITEYPTQTPYWEKDICDAIRVSLNNEETISQVDIKGIYIKWDVNRYPTIDEINGMQLRRSTRCPDKNNIVERPLIMLMEEPWRNFNKLRTQFGTFRMKRRVDHPHENLCFLCPKFTLSSIRDDNDFLNLYENYYNIWEHTSNKRADFIPITQEVPENLQRFTFNSTLFPESITWVINNWDRIQNCLDNMINQLMEFLEDFWIWVFGFIDQASTNYFERVYQNDRIVYDSSTIWSSATRSPHEKKWTDFQKGKRKSEPNIAGDEHPHLYWNNNTIDVSSEFVYAVNDRL